MHQTKLPKKAMDVTIVNDNKREGTMNDDRQRLIKDLKSYPLLISEVENPDLELQTIAVNSFPLAILFIKNPHVEVQKIVIERDQKYIRQINNPSPEIISLIKDQFLKEETLKRINSNEKNLFFNLDK